MKYSLLFFFLCTVFFARGEKGLLRLVDGQEEYSMTDYQYLNNCNGKWPEASILSGACDDQFVTNKNPLHLTTNGKCEYWLKINILNSSRKKSQWIIEFYDFKIDRITFYVSNNNGEIKKYEAGDALPFSSKSFFHKNIGFPLKADTGKVDTYYVQVKTSEVVALTFLVRSYQQLLHYALQEYLILGLYYGIILLIIVLNLFIFYTSRDYVYLYYICYVLSITLFSLMVVDGIGFQFLWPYFPQLNTYAIPISSVCLIVSALWYARSFLLLKVNFPVLDKVILFIIAFRVLVFVLDFNFHFYNSWNPFYDWAALFAAYLAGIYCLIKGYTPARYYVVAFTFVFCGYLIFALGNRGIISSNFITVYALNYAVAIELILLSLALAERIEAFKKEKEIAQKEKVNQLIENGRLQKNIIEQLRENEVLKDKVNRELEEKVKERTADLLEAQNKIEEMNRLLNDDNKKLQSNVKKLFKDRIMQKTVSFEEFQNIYPDEKTCYEFIESLKWGKGYECMECKNKKYALGNMPYSRRCSKCGLIESVTLGTIFYRLKFPVVKAFYMVFLVSSNPKITSEELSKTITLRKQTCWAFKKKILDRISKSVKKNKSDGWSHLILSSEQKEFEL